MSDLLTLVAVAIPFVITPGASFTLTLAHAVRREGRSWLPIAAGTGLGILVLALLMGATGIGALLNGSPTARLLLGLVGAVVLITFGVLIMTRARRAPPEQSSPTRPRSLLRWSLVAVLTNPKALALYVVIVPTLPTAQVEGGFLFVLFAAVHIMLLAGWLFVVHSVATQLPVLARSIRLQRFLVTLAGVAMIILGVLAGSQAILV